MHIRTDAALAEIIAALRREPLVAADTEAASFHRYRDRIFLVQLSSPRQTAIIDPLAVRDLAPVGELLADPQVEKIFHDADYDLRILDRDYGFRARRLCDTRIAAQLAGERAVGLAALLDKYLGVKLSKEHQKAPPTRAARSAAGAARGAGPPHVGGGGVRATRGAAMDRGRRRGGRLPAREGREGARSAAARHAAGAVSLAGRGRGGGGHRHVPDHRERRAARGEQSAARDARRAGASAGPPPGPRPPPRRGPARRGPSGADAAGGGAAAHRAVGAAAQGPRARRPGRAAQGGPQPRCRRVGTRSRRAVREGHARGGSACTSKRRRRARPRGGAPALGDALLGALR